MDLASIRQHILTSNQTAGEKAKAFLRKNKVHELSKDVWRELIAGIPDEVEEEICILKSAGTHLRLHTGWKVQVSN